jgi:hypothetical protein
MPSGHYGLHTQSFVIKKFLNTMLMPHIIFYDQNISLKYATSNTKEPKNKKAYNKFGVNAMKRENRHLVATRD